MVCVIELMQGDRRDDVEEAFADRGKDEHGDHDEEAVGEGHDDQPYPEMRPLCLYILVAESLEKCAPFLPCAFYRALPEEEKRNEQEDDGEVEAAQQEAVPFRHIVEQDETAE